MRALVCLLFVLLVPAAAPAATLRAPGVRDATCRVVRDGAAVDRARFVARTDGLLTVRLRAPRGDWDLGVFDGAGRRHGAAATFGARETVIATVRAGERVLAQGCRRAGSAGRAHVTFDLYPMKLGRGADRARLIRVPLLSAGALARLQATGADVTHNAGTMFADVLVRSAAERARLAAQGFEGRVLPGALSPDPVSGAAARAAALPSGGTAYREYDEYGEDLKALVAQYPGHVRPLVAGQSLEGRPIEGVEIAAQVGRSDDGRPTLLLLGLHHAREWPSGEMPMEFAIDLARGYGRDPRITDVLNRVRVIVLPLVNPDGFVVSRGAGTAPTDDDANATLTLALTDAAAYKRKNCRATNPSDQGIPCADRAMQGVDLNRNYGAYWGGAGSSTSPTAQNHRGAAPYSEPESEAIHRLSQTRNIVTVVSHHTFTDEGVWLRQPGFCKTAGACDPEVDVVPDEGGMKVLGDSMAEATGWTSELGWAIGEITGATEDWNYFATGAYGYTPEQRGPNFHPTFANAVVAEYDGSGAGADGGVREALLRAAEQAANRTWHSIIEGRAPAGRILRLRKSFRTPTSVAGVSVDDALDLTLTVPDTGTFVWDVNPSTRPLAGAPEAYTLTCERPGGEVLETREVVVARNEARGLALACGEAEPPPPPSSKVTRLSVAKKRLRAAKVRRRDAFRVAVRARNGAARDVIVTARNRRGRVVARGTRDVVEGRRKVRLKVTRRVRRGVLRIEAVGYDDRYAKLRATRKLRVR